MANGYASSRPFPPKPPPDLLTPNLRRKPQVEHLHRPGHRRRHVRGRLGLFAQGGKSSVRLYHCLIIHSPVALCVARLPGPSRHAIAQTFPTRHHHLDGYREERPADEKTPQSQVVALLADLGPRQLLYDVGNHLPGATQPVDRAEAIRPEEGVSAPVKGGGREKHTGEGAEQPLCLEQQEGPLRRGQKSRHRTPAGRVYPDRCGLRRLHHTHIYTCSYIQRRLGIG